MNGSENFMVCGFCYTNDGCIHFFSDTFNSPNSPPKSAMPSTLQCLTPVDLDDAELEAYAEECATRAALADFEDIPPEDLFSWSDSEELNGASSRDSYDEDVDMMH
jgi:hypothetical protein